MKKAKTPVWKAPEFITPTIRVPQPDGGILVRAGKPVLLDEMIGTAEAARLLGMSRRWIESECSEGRFKSASKPGTAARAHWKIARAEVLSRLEADPC